MIKGILFDMDGVICHTNPYHSQAFKIFFEKRNLFPTEQAFRAHMYGKSNSYILSYFLGRSIDGDELVAMENEKEALFREIYADKVKPIGRLLDFLESVKLAGLKTAVATSAPRANMELILDKLAIADKFESKLGSEDVDKHKPNPEVYQKSMNNLGLTPMECVVFEDSFSGVSAGIRAGCSVIGVLSSHTKEELPPCLLHTKDYMNMSLEDLQKKIKWLPNPLK